MKNNRLLILILFAIQFSTYVISQEDFNFEDFLQGLIKEIDEQTQQEEATIEKSIDVEAKKEAPKKEGVLIKSVDLKTDFLEEFPPTPKKDEKKLSEDEKKKLELPNFKKESLDYYLSQLSTLIGEIRKKVSGFSDYQKKKFDPLQKNISESIELLDKIRSNEVYYKILYEAEFNALRKKIVNITEKLRDLDTNLEIAITEPPRKKPIKKRI